MKALRLALAVAGIAWSAGLVAEPDPTDSALRIRGIFDAPLPGTERKNSLRLIFHPHFGDLTEREHLRIPLGLRYGFTRNLEGTLEIEGYLSHGLKAAAFADDLGLSQIHLGAKYRLERELLRGWDTAVGFDYTHPLGAPPVDVTDGLTHIAPYFTFARTLERHPDLRVFWGVGADMVNKTSVPGRLSKNQLGDDTVNFTGGLVWKHGNFHYTLEADWRTTDWVGADGRGNYFALRPGLVWEVPAEITRSPRGQWLLGFGLRAAHGPDGFDLGAGAKVRVNFDLKRLLGRRSVGR